MTEELFDKADRHTENDSQNANLTDETETGDDATKQASPKRPIAKWVPMGTIDFDDKTYQVRLNDDADTIGKENRTWRR